MGPITEDSRRQEWRSFILPEDMGGLELLREVILERRVDIFYDTQKIRQGTVCRKNSIKTWGWIERTWCFWTQKCNLMELVG